MVHTRCVEIPESHVHVKSMLRTVVRRKDIKDETERYNAETGLTHKTFGN